MIHPSLHTHFIPAIKDKYKQRNRTTAQAKKAGTYELTLIALAQYDCLRKILERLSPAEKEAQPREGGNDR
jgi:hypothetical protein